jgi:hypothetical protein
MDVKINLLNDYKSLYQSNENIKGGENIKGDNIIYKITNFIKENDEIILTEFLNEIIEIMLNGKYQNVKNDSVNISEMIFKFAEKQIPFDIDSIFDVKNDCFFKEIENYNIRGLLFDIIAKHYYIDEYDFLKIFQTLPAKNIRDSIVYPNISISDINRLMYFKYNSKYLQSNFKHDDDNLDKKTYINVNGIFNDFLKYYSKLFDYNYWEIKDILKHQLNLFKNCNIKFTINEFKILINEDYAIEILRNNKRNPIIKKSNLIKLSIIKAYFLDILIEDNITEINKNIFTFMSNIKAQLYGDCYGQLKYFSLYLRKIFNINDENLKLNNYDIMYENIYDKVNYIFFEHGDKNIKVVIDDLLFWHTEFFLSQLSKDLSKDLSQDLSKDLSKDLSQDLSQDYKKIYDAYSKHFLHNSTIIQLFKNYDNNINIVSNAKNFKITNNTFALMKNYENNDNFTQKTPQYFQKLKKLSIDREKLVDTISYYHGKFNYISLNTLYLAVNFLDKYLYKSNILDKYDLKIVNITCFILASKYEDDYNVEYSKLLMGLRLVEDENFKDVYNKCLEFERDIFEKLDYTLYLPTTYYFYDVFTENINIILYEQELNMILYIIELSLQYQEFLSFKYSMIAISAIYLIVKSNENMVDLLTTLSDININDVNFKKCINLLTSKLSLDIKNLEFTRIRNKYYDEYELLKSI